MSLNAHVCDKIRSCRRRLGVSQEEMATAMNMSRGSWYKYEHGEIFVRLDHLLQIAAYLRVHYLDLLEGYIPPSQPLPTATRKLDLTQPASMSSSGGSPGMLSSEDDP